MIPKVYFVFNHDERSCEAVKNLGNDGEMAVYIIGGGTEVQPSKKRRLPTTAKPNTTVDIRSPNPRASEEGETTTTVDIRSPNRRGSEEGETTMLYEDLVKQNEGGPSNENHQLNNAHMLSPRSPAYDPAMAVKGLSRSSAIVRTSTPLASPINLQEAAEEPGRSADGEEQAIAPVDSGCAIITPVKRNRRRRLKLNKNPGILTQNMPEDSQIAAAIDVDFWMSP
ncbi:uncharacterized protein LOC134771550 [Penaeus indicus]|uniref:uncharacterized protein LOC134767031 n=1 Tax=Penaeus indicus TaxID=29960 RepID=UPI00300D25AB